MLKNHNTKIKKINVVIDFDLKSSINGIELANQLYNADCTKICLLSGRYFTKSECPNYLMALIKGDMVSLDKLIAQW